MKILAYGWGTVPWKGLGKVIKTREDFTCNNTNFNRSKKIGQKGTYSGRLFVHHFFVIRLMDWAQLTQPPENLKEGTMRAKAKTSYKDTHPKPFAINSY